MGKPKVETNRNRNNNRFFSKSKVKFSERKGEGGGASSKNTMRHKKASSKTPNEQMESNKQPSSVKSIKSDGFFVTSIDNADDNVASSSSSRTTTDKKATAAAKKVTVKKPFDKKQWRLQKYSKKYKLDKWEERRKKTVLREYYREIKDDRQFDVERIYKEEEERERREENIDCGKGETDKEDGAKEETENDNNVNADIRLGQQLDLKGGKRKKAFRRAHEEYERIKGEKKRRREELNKRKVERDEALKVYNEKKIQKFKILNKKTRKGQPIMKGRIQMLLEQIQNSISNEQR